MLKKNFCTLKFYTPQTPKLVYKNNLLFLNKRLTTLDKLAGQCFYGGRKLFILKQFNLCYTNWKRGALYKLRSDYRASDEKSGFKTVIESIPFILSCAQSDDFWDVNSVLAWRSVQYNIIFRFNTKYLKKRTITTVRYVVEQRRQQLLWRWLALSFKLVKNSPKVTYQQAFANLSKIFFIQAPQQHKFNKLKNKIYRTYLIQ